MSKRFIALLLAVTMVFTLVVGCSKPAEPATPTEPTTPTQPEEPATPEEPKDVGVLNWNIGADPKTIDPVLNGASDGGDVINQTFEGLVSERNGEIFPGIAESWEVSDDGLKLTFHLRDSKWSDGTPLTANDFVYSWKRGMDPKTASEYAFIWEYTNIKGALEAVEGGSLDEVGVSAPDDKTLVVELNVPTDYLISLLSFYHFKPTKQEAVEAGEDGMWAKTPKIAVCNGPFKLTRYVIGEGLTLVKNEHYWDAANVKLEGIEGKFIDDHSTAYQAYQAGQLDFIPQVPLAEIPKLIAEDPNFYIFPLLGTYYYNFNLKLDLFKDPKVRRALTLAIDRELIVETLGAGQVPANGFISPGFKDDKGKDFYETAGNYGIPTDGSGIEEAKKLLAEAGFPDGKGFPEFTIMYNTSDAHRAVAELIQEMFKTNLGINTKLENQEWAVFQDTRKAGDYEMARGGWLTDYMDPSGMLSIFTTRSAYNDPKYNNEAYDNALTEAAKTIGAPHFEQLYKAQDMLMNDLPILPVYHYTEYYLVGPQVQGWQRSVLGTVDFVHASITR